MDAGETADMLGFTHTINGIAGFKQLRNRILRTPADQKLRA